MNLHLRPVTPNDSRLLYCWKEHPSTKENSFTKTPISYENHNEWLLSKLSDKNCFMFILMDSSECVGQIRIDINHHIGKISYMIAPNKRNLGYGKKLLALIEAQIPQDIKALIGFVQNFNRASQRCFLENHYSEFFENNILCYIKILS